MNHDDQMSGASFPILAPLENALYTHMNHSGSQMMINRIMSILNDRLDDAQQHKDSFQQNPMQPLLFDVLRDIKQKNGKEKNWINFDVSENENLFQV